MQQSKRENVSELLKSKTTTVKEIAKRCGVSLKTVYNVRTKLSKLQSLKHRKGAGRPMKMSKNNKISLSFKLRNNPRISVRSLANEFQASQGLNISRESVRRTIKSMGFSKKTPIRGPGITPQNEKTRVDWAKKHRNIHWHKIIFTDECSIWLNQGKIQMWTKGERPILNIPRHTPKVHIWGGISARGATPVKIFKQNFNSEHYCDVLNEVLFQTAEILYPDGWKLQEDNSSIHKSKISCAFKETHRIRSIDWPPNSPDLNPIENLWGVLKQRIMVNSPKTIDEVETMIYSQWETFDPDFLTKFTKSMKKRCDLVIASGGKKINY